MWLLVVIHRASLPLHLCPLRSEGHWRCEGGGSRVAACRRNVGTTSGASKAVDAFHTVMTAIYCKLL